MTESDLFHAWWDSQDDLFHEAYKDDECAKPLGWRVWQAARTMDAPDATPSQTDMRQPDSEPESPQAEPVAWIAHHESAGTLHLSKREGWTVEVALTEPRHPDWLRPIGFEEPPAAAQGEQGMEWEPPQSLSRWVDVQVSAAQGGQPGDSE